MAGRTEVAIEIVKEVLRASLSLNWAKEDELDREAKAIAEQLPRIRSHRDATLATRRVFASSFGEGVQLSEEELAFAGRLLAFRIRAVGLGDGSLTLEGYTSDEILKLLDADLRQTVFSGRPIVFDVGSAQVLGAFKIEGSRLVVELAHVDGGGEGVLTFLSSLTRRFALAHGILTVEWLVHALTCAAPNLKLRELLERRGFVQADHNARPVLRLIETIR